jgi:uncharacterized cupredoxin-like copper-binding protein
MRRQLIALGVVGVLSLGSVACSEDEAASLDVVLSEWIVDPAESSVAAGETTIVADNQGGEEHELLVVRGTQADLPINDETGAVDEAALEASGKLLGEIEGVAARSTKEGEFDLDTAGTYVLLCNIEEEEDDGTIESHYAEGMVAEITVTE